jgi:DNA-binding GntR family transcriptional regulator
MGSKIGSVGSLSAHHPAARKAKAADRQPAHLTLADDLAARIQADITAGRIPLGSWLRQETLAAEHGVSRTPVREALRKLQAAGAVELWPRRGALVRAPTVREIREAYYVRAELEGIVAELAAAWITDRELGRLREAEELFRQAVRDTLERRRRDGAPAEAEAEWVRANDLFHEVLQEAAGNDRLRLMIDDLHRSFPRRLSWAPLREDSRLLTDNVAQHRGILEAVERRDGAAARRLMIEHLQRAGELVARRFERDAR